MARRTFWSDTIIFQDKGSNTESILGLLQDLDLQQSTELTLIRTIIELDVLPDPESIAVSTQKVSLGIMVVSNEAVSIGTTAVPDPEVGGDFPSRGWIYRTSRGVHMDNSIGLPPLALQADIRSKRRVDRGDLIIKFTNRPALGTGQNVLFTGIVRCLLLMP